MKRISAPASARPLSVRVIAVAAVLLLLVALPASAAQFHGGDIYTLPAGETVSDNVYAGGGTVTISGTVEGDVVTAGGTVTITGTVLGDVLAAGGNVDIRGAIEGDVRAVGGDVTVSGAISGEVVAAGGTVRILPDATIATDVVINGGALTMAGTTTGALIANGGMVDLSGSVAEDVRVKADELIVRSSAVVNRDVSFSGPRDAQIEEGAEISGTYAFTQREYVPDHDKRQIRGLLGGAFTTFVLLRLFGAVVLGLLLLGLMHRSLHHVVVEAGSRPGRSLLTGFLVLVSLIPLVLLLFMSLVGIPVAFLVMLLAGLILMLAIPLAGIIFGSLAWSWYIKPKELPLNWKIVVGGIAVLAVVRLIPVIGWLIACLAYLVAVGAVGQVAYRVFRKHA